MLKNLFFICVLLLIAQHSFAQDPEVSPLEYKVSKEYFKEHYVKDEEDQKIVDLFAKKNKEIIIWLGAGSLSALASNYTSVIPLGGNFTISPLTPLVFTFATISIIKVVRYSRKNKYLFVTGKKELPRYVKVRIAAKN